MVERHIHSTEHLRIQAILSNVSVSEDRLVSLQSRLEELFQGIDSLDKLITPEEEPATNFVGS